MANKIKSGLSLIAALAAVVVLPLKLQAWAEELSKEQVLVERGRQEVIDSRQNATEQYNFYTLRIEDTEDDLVYLEEKEAEEELTPTEKRKHRKLEKDLEAFEQKQLEALEQLQELEHDHETH